jgi:hypothetical protein
MLSYHFKCKLPQNMTLQNIFMNVEKCIFNSSNMHINSIKVRVIVYHIGLLNSFLLRFVLNVLVITYQ